MPKFHKNFNPSSQKINEWFSSDGDNTYSLNHSLSDDSVVVEIGGYTTSWAAKFKEDCLIYVVEPVKKFHDTLKDKHKGRPNFKTINAAIGTENKTVYLPEEKMNNDATDLLNLDENNTSGEKIQIITLEKLMKDNNIEYIDLMQINIEGWEYPILEDWIKTGLIHKIKTLQIQFHPFEGVEDPIGRRAKIQDNLANLGYHIKFKFDWVWECWEK